MNKFKKLYQGDYSSLQTTLYLGIQPYLCDFGKDFL